jgi:hypothetical protein
VRILKKDAYRLGQLLAGELHEYENPVARGAVLAVRDGILLMIPAWESRMELQRGFNVMLDELEPLPSSAPRGLSV